MRSKIGSTAGIDPIFGPKAPVTRVRMMQQRLLVLFFCFLLLLPLTSSASFTHAAPDSDYTGGTRNGNEQNIRLYFHGSGSGASMTTSPSTTAPFPQIETVRSNQQLRFERNGSLLGDLRVLGRDTDYGQKGLKMEFPMEFIGTTGEATVTIRVKDDGMDVAEHAFRFTSPRTARSIFELPFVDAGKSEHTFRSGSMIAVTIDIELSSGTLTLRWDDADNEAYLSLYCDPFASKTIRFKNHRGVIRTEFEPNLPSEVRTIMFSIDAVDVFGPSHIPSATVTVRSPEDETLLSAATMERVSADDEVAFQYSWSYPKGFPAGTGYHAYFDLVDADDNHYNFSKTFTMSQYGVYLRPVTGQMEVVANETAEAEVEVFNSGAAQDTIRLQTVPSIEDWSAVFETNGDDSYEVGIGAGRNKTVTLLVTAPSDAEEEDVVELEVDGRSINSQAGKLKTYDISIPVTVAPGANFQFTPISGQLSADIANGETHRYRFTLSNTGETNDSYMLLLTPSAGAVPEGWFARAVSDDGVLDAVDAEVLENYETTLEAGASMTVVLEVRAPDEATASALNFELTISASSQQQSSRSISHFTVTTTPLGAGSVFGLTPVGSTTKQSSVLDPAARPLTYAAASFSFRVENALPTPIELSIDISGLPPTTNWELGTDNYSVGADEQRSFALEVTPQSDAMADSYPFQISVSAAYGGQTYDEALETTLVVEQFHLVNISAPDPASNQFTAADTTHTFSFNITNEGNGKEKVHIGVVKDTLPENWRVQLSAVDLELLPGETRWITLNVTSPGAIEDGFRDEIDITISYEDTAEEDTLALEVVVVVPPGVLFTKVLEELWVLLILFVIVVVVAAWAYRRSHKGVA